MKRQLHLGYTYTDACHLFLAFSVCRDNDIASFRQSIRKKLYNTSVCTMSLYVAYLWKQQFLSLPPTLLQYYHQFSYSSFHSHFVSFGPTLPIYSILSILSLYSLYSFFSLALFVSSYFLSLSFTLMLPFFLIIFYVWIHTLL